MYKENAIAKEMQQKKIKIQSSSFEENVSNIKATLKWEIYILKIKE